MSLQTNLAGQAEVVFSPEPNYHGHASFGYTVTDQYALSSQATTARNIAAVNDDPVAIGATATGDEDPSLQFRTATLLVNDTD